MDNDELTIRAGKTVGMTCNTGVPSGMPDDASMDRTIRIGTPDPSGSDCPPSAEVSATCFVLRDCQYRNIRTLSNNSGEAQVFLVERDGKEYVLKLYYPNVRIKKDVLRIIANISFDMIVRLYDFGHIYLDGNRRYYELMEHLRGGTLGTYRLGKDIDAFRRIALQAAAALECCHKNKVIHKDIKPSNFFFRDESHNELVLGDFGISSMMAGEGKMHRTMQARTPMYAAPEMYNDVIDGEVEISSAADYYSLGLTLLTIWNGKSTLGNDERMLMKMKSEGRLAGVNELPDRVRLIIQGLTAVKPASRWSYTEVERWFMGESPKVDLTSPFLKYCSFVFDPERNLIADSVKELILLMEEYERTACGYLYSGKITDWLEQCGNTRLSIAVDDIVKNRYPVDRKAGLNAAMYMMDSELPYVDVKGRKCIDVHDIVMTLINNMDEYASVLINRNARLWIYLETHVKCDVDRMRGYFVDGSGQGCKHAVMRMVYELEPDIPFLAGHPSSTIKEIVHCFGYDNLPDDAWHSLTDGRLLSWMYSHEDKMACESLRIMTEGKSYSEQLAYKVLYNVDRTVAYDLREADTPQKVGEVLDEQLRKWQRLDDEAFAEKMTEYSCRDGRFQYFARLHGWMEQIGEAQRCFDIDSAENRERLGVYDLRTAAYRMCRILGVVPSYSMADGTLLRNGLEIDNRHRSAIRTEIRSGYFPQWLSVFYHENPEADFSEAYSYERMLERWITVLGNYDAQMPYNKRFLAAKAETARKYDEVRRGYRKAKTKEGLWQAAFYLLGGLWMLLVLLYGVGNHHSLLANSMMAIGLPVGGMTAMIVGTRAFFRGYGFAMSCLWGGVGFMTSLIPVYALKFIEAQWPVLFVPVILVFSIIYMGVCHFTDSRGDSKEDNKLLEQMLSDDVKSTLIEPLYYTFKTKSYRFKGSKFGVLDDAQDRIHSISGEIVLHYVLWCVMVALLVVEMVVYNPRLMNVSNPGQAHWQVVSSVHVEPVNNSAD